MRRLTAKREGPKSVAAVALISGNHSASPSWKTAQKYGHTVTPGQCLIMGHASMPLANSAKEDEATLRMMMTLTDRHLCASGSSVSRPPASAAEATVVTTPFWISSKPASLV